MDTSKQEPRKRTITLTGRPPVRITESEWPILGRSYEAVDSCNGTPLPDYQRVRWTLTVRRHADGRAIVYGVASPPENGWPTHGCVDWKGGVYLGDGDPMTGAGRGEVSMTDILNAVQRVGTDLIGMGGAPERIVRECIADLPPEEV